MAKKLIHLLLIALCLGLVACQSGIETTPPTAVLPTTPALNEPDSPATEPTAEPTETAVVPAEPETDPATPVVTAEPPPTLTPPSAQAETVYRVAFVESDDTLNVRSGPGVENGVVGELAPTANNIRITGAGQQVAGSTWVPIATSNLTGWVNGRFLTSQISSDQFCNSEAVDRLIDELQTAVANQNSDQLAALIHPERGLRVRVSWWNPEVRFAGNGRLNLFSDSTRYDWGTEDGTGDLINGSFSDVIVPLLQQDLVAAEQRGCNEILNGGSAGFIQLPDGYAQTNYVSLYRPGSEQFAGMDWGTWVVGVEAWEGQLYVTYLVHFAWEI